MNELAKLASYLASGWRVRSDSHIAQIFMAKGARYEASSLRLAGQKRQPHNFNFHGKRGKIRGVESQVGGSEEAKCKAREGEGEGAYFGT